MSRVTLCQAIAVLPEGGSARPARAAAECVAIGVESGVAVTHGFREDQAMGASGTQRLVKSVLLAGIILLAGCLVTAGAQHAHAAVAAVAAVTASSPAADAAATSAPPPSPTPTVASPT